MPKKYIVNLTEPEREIAKGVIQKCKNANKVKRAYVLLGADRSPDGLQLTDEVIKQTYGVSIRTIERLRQRFVSEGFELALNGKPPYRPGERKIDGEVEAHLLALTRSEVPYGYERWTLRLLAEKMVALAYIETISHESVRQILKKTYSRSTNDYVG